jgi:hypothetical protein
MNNTKVWGKLLLWIHLFIVSTWLVFFRLIESDPTYIPVWIIHIFILSILGIQFSWGFTVGLNVGPSRKKRDNLWWSLLTVFLPVWFFNFLIKGLWQSNEWILALIYGTVFVVLLGCETYCGVLLGVKTHAETKEE